MINRHLQAAAALGPNMKARSQALAGQDQALGQMCRATKDIHPGNRAGMMNHKAAVLEFEGHGYGSSIKAAERGAVSMHLSRPSAGVGRRIAAADYRGFSRAKLGVDEALRGLL